MNREALMSALRELARLVILAILGAGIAWLTQLQASFDPASVQALAITLVLRVADKYLYKNNGTNVFRF